MNLKDGVIVIDKTGESINEEFSEINPRHWLCFKELESKFGLEPLTETDQMEHAWYLARNGYISIQIASNICYIIVSPILENVTNNQLEKFNDILSNYKDVDIFGIDFVSENDHKPVIIDDQFDFNYDEVKDIFGLNKKIK